MRNVSKNNSNSISELLVTVIIPTFNRKKYLFEAVNSVCNQSYKNIEIIIVDDGSTDGSRDAVKTIKDKRINYIWQKNSGLPAKARNVGIKLSKGEFIAFLDSDDLWLPDKLKLQLAFMGNHPEVGLLGTNGIEFPGEVVIRPAIHKPVMVSLKQLVQFNVFINSSVLIRKEVVDRIGFLDTDPAIRAAEDWEYWMRACNVCTGAVLPDVLIRYRIHENNINATEAMSALEQSLQLERYMRVLSRFEKMPELKSSIAAFRRRQEIYLASTQCRERFIPTIGNLVLAFKSKALLRTKFKLLGWYFGVRRPSICQSGRPLK